MSRFTKETAEQFLRVGDVFYWNEPDSDEPNAQYQLNMNDTFGWALAFGQPVSPDEMIEVASLYACYGDCGLYYWVSEKNEQMCSEFEDINRKIDFVRHEEKLVKEISSSNERAYKKLQYTLGANYSTTVPDGCNKGCAKCGAHWDEAMRRAQSARLIKLAAQMVQGIAMPDIDGWPWPTRATRSLWGAAVKAQRDAVEQCRLWGIEVKQVADELLARARGGK